MSGQRAQVIARALAQAEEKFFVAGGPGGQHVNKVATAVQLRLSVDPLGLTPGAYRRLVVLAGTRLTKDGDLVLTAREYRTQEQNREAARKRLAALLEQALTPPRPRAKTQLNRVGKTQRLKAKKARAAVKAGRGKVEW